MEELRTSKALEEEILNDARKKAERILRNQEKEAEQLRSEMQAQLQADLDALEKEYRARERALIDEIDSVAPLARKRRRIAYLDRTVREHLDGYFDRLNGETRERLMISLIGRAKDTLDGGTLEVEYGKIDEETAGRILRTALPDGKVVRMEQRPRLDGIVIRFADGSRRYRATMHEVRDYLLARHREALARGLFGKGGPA